MDNNNGDEILLKVGLDTTGAEQSADALNKKVQNISQQDLGTSNVKSYKLQIRELTAELQRIEQVQGRNSQAFRDGAKELGRLKVAARDFKDQIEAYDPSNRLAGIANIAKGAAVGMTGLAGAVGLLGIHGAKAEEVMLKLQSVLALSHALGSVHELASGWRSFINVLGLGTTKAKAQTDAVVEGAAEQVAATETVIAVTTEQQAAEERLGAAQEAVNQLELDAQAALAAAKAEGLDATVAMTGAEQAYLETMAAKSAAVAELTAAQTAYNESLALGSEANVATAATTELVTVAEEGAAVAATGFGTALKAIGIGFIIALLAYLISNWDNVKKSVENLFPSLKNAGNIFNEIKEIAFGLGNVILQWVISPIKVLIDLLQGDLKSAFEDFKKGWAGIDNYKEGAAKEAASIAEAARIVELQKIVDHNERLIKEQKALGKDTTDLEVKTQQLKLQLLDKSAEDYAKKYADGQSEITVIQNTAIKKRNDEAERLRKESEQKAAAIKKADLDKLKSGNDAASKVIQGGLKSQRDIELSDADFKYKSLIAIAKKYGQDTSKLREAQGIEEARINKKYADQINDYLLKSDEDTLSEFDKKRLEINKAANDALKNATPAEKAKIIQTQAFQLNKVNDNEKYSDAADAAKLNETNIEDANRPGVGAKPDSLEVQYQKEEAIRQAKLASLTANYQKERDLAAYNYDQLKQLDADYNKASKDSADESAKAKIELSKAEKEAKLKDLSAVGDALGAFAGVMGKNTVAAKALGVAQATISTYVAAAETLADPSLPFFAKAFAVAGIVASGLANVKNILAVKVPGATGGAGSSTPQYSAPTINSTVLNQAQTGVQQVQVVNQQDTSKQQPIKAYVVEKDITSKQDRAAYLDRQATI